MKQKITLSFLALSLILISCKKDLTCSCTTTSRATGTSYNIIYNGSSYYQITEPIEAISDPSTNTDVTTYSGTWKRSVAEYCPTKSVSTDVNDQTTFSGYYGPNGEPLLGGYETTTTVTRTCELEKE
jgi:hypothetical protein